MSLSCSCYEYDGEGVFWYPPDWFVNLTTKRRKRCLSCNSLINLNTPCLEFPYYSGCKDDIEYRIHGDVEIRRGTYRLCESCGEIYLNLSSIGYCLDISNSMVEYLKEYHELTGFKKEGLDSSPE